jgi:hypothetical protein
MTKETVDTRQFSVSPHIIYSLIKAQAGTLAKGVLECIMNSVDAGAASIDIVLNNRSLTVTDDGKGFKTRAEIEACFEVFGFEHHEGDRSYGQFGIGRAQLWNFCSTVWHTNEFRMDVDIKNRGLDYDLIGNAGPVKGLRIEGTFYEPMSTSDVLACERELKELAAYVHIPVTFNGERISQDPADRKWTHETDDAWISLSNVSSSLTVYNLGVKVKDYSSYHVGCGGLVVTKPGVRLSLNMARNDILMAECKVWKRIRPFLQNKTDEVVKKTSRLTEEQMANMATRFLSGDIAYRDIENRKLIRDVVGGNHTLAEFYDRAWGSFDQVVTYAPKNEAGPAAEESHKQGYCFVLAQKTLQRFSVRTLDEFMRKVEAQLHLDGMDAVATRKKAVPGQPPVVQRLKVDENWKTACSKISDGHTDIPHKDWTKPEQAALSALRISSMSVLRILKHLGLVANDTQLRELRLGVSDVAGAWTDGSHTITFERRALAALDQGCSGALHVISALVHEYLHEGPTSGTHVHDEEFYERYHQAMYYYPQNTWGQAVGDVVNRLMADYMKECSKRKVHIKSRIRQHSENAEAFGIADAA